MRLPEPSAEIGSNSCVENCDDFII